MSYSHLKISKKVKKKKLIIIWLLWWKTSFLSNLHIYHKNWDKRLEGSLLFLKKQWFEHNSLHEFYMKGNEFERFLKEIPDINTSRNQERNVSLPIKFIPAAARKKAWREPCRNLLKVFRESTVSDRMVRTI